jgi:DTW domain-containing protein YfiP
MQIAISRRFGDQVDPTIMQALHDRPTLLLFPGPNAVSLEEGVQEALRTQQQQTASSSIKINLLVLDATWKYAKEMDQANRKHDIYPSSLIRIQLSTSDLGPHPPRRFDIRTPPSEHHLSTAEAIAVVLAKLEQDENLYGVLMKPVDLMVQQWKSHYVSHS